MVVIWALSYLAATFLAAQWSYAPYAWLGIGYSSTVELGIQQGAATFLGCWLTLVLMKISPERAINGKTVLAGALGFGLGNFLTNILFEPLDDGWVYLQLATWGLLAGAALAFPSRKAKQYLAMAGAGAIGMGLGYALSDHRLVLMGGFAGLILGGLTQNFSAALTISLAGLLGFGWRLAIHQAFVKSGPLDHWPGLILMALGASLAGAIIAAALSYFERERAEERPRPASAPDVIPGKAVALITEEVPPARPAQAVSEKRLLLNGVVLVGSSLLGLFLDTQLHLWLPPAWLTRLFTALLLGAGPGLALGWLVVDGSLRRRWKQALLILAAYIAGLYLILGLLVS